MITLLPTTFILSACLPSFFFSFLLCCFFGTGFNSPSDQFGIHKPLSTLLWKHYLQGMMSGSGDNDYSRTSFPDVVCDRECCHTMRTGWLILTEGMWGMVSFSVPSVSHSFKFALPLFDGEIYSSSSSAEQIILKGIWVCPSFIRVLNFLGDRLLNFMHFWGKPDPTGVCPRHSCAASTYQSRGLCVWWAKNRQENTPWCFPFFIQFWKCIFVYITLFLSHHKWPIHTNCLGSANLSFWLIC